MKEPTTYKGMLARMYGLPTSKIKVDGFYLIVDPKNRGDIWDRAAIRKMWQQWQADPVGVIISLN